MESETPDSFVWEPSPISKFERLVKALNNHLKKAGVSKQNRTIGKRREFVQSLLQKQAGTCYFAGGDDRYCWNQPRDGRNGLKYLNLQWGHKIPRAQGNIAHDPKNLILQCARCNNQLQTSRTVKQLIVELEHKLNILKSKNENL